MVSDSRPPSGCIVALGCAGALVVMVAFGFAALFYFGFVQRGGVYDELRVQLAESQLNLLVPYIEMYRSRHGAYPESLEQVAEMIPANTPVMIQDASSPPLGPTRTYYYERVGEAHYLPRSVGADGSPFTEDDIVPNGFEAGQTGLVLERPAASSPAPPSETAPAN